MKKRFFKTSFILIVLITLIGCNNNKNVVFDKMIFFTKNISPIRDSINKINGYDVKLLICTFNEDLDYNYLYLKVPETPYNIKNNFIFEKINGLNVLFINDKDTIIKNKKNIIHLLEDNIITYEDQNMFKHYPYYKFVFCKKNKLNIKCFKNTINLEDLESLKPGEQYHERMFYPKCVN